MQRLSVMIQFDNFVALLINSRFLSFTFLERTTNNSKRHEIAIVKSIGTIDQYLVDWWFKYWPALFTLHFPA